MKSIKLITQDRPGIVADIAEKFAQRHINIETVEGKSIGTYAVLELFVDRPDEAMHVLHEQDMLSVSSDLITIRIADQPGALAKVARELTDAKLSLRGISTLQRQDGYCLVALSTDNDTVARKLLHDVLF